MNVRCPSCDTLYRVDPEKVPEHGVKARCAECSSEIAVAHTVEDPIPDERPDYGTGSVVEETQVFLQAGEVEQDAAPVVEAEQEIPPVVEVEHEGVSVGEVEQELPPSLEETVSDWSLVASAPVPETPVDLSEDSIPDIPAPPDVVPPEPIDEHFESVELAPSPEPVSASPELEERPFAPLQQEEVEETGSAPVIPLAVEVPPIPAAPVSAEPPVSVEAESPEPVTEPVERPPLEVVPSDEKPPDAGTRRYTRPFVRPPTESIRQPTPTSSVPTRPTAPVFRPTPGMPVQTPSLPVAEPPADLPLDSPAAPAVVEGPSPEPVADLPEKPQRPVNPFLSKDPKLKARRLARALVSDMIVYQPQKRQDALAAGTLKESFDEEIKKSWEEYVDQVGEELANSTEFFKEALNEILAGGNELF